MRLLLILSLTALLIGASAVAQDGIDPRRPALRTQEQKTFILDQMRLFVASIQAIDEGLSEHDCAKVAAAARPRGLNAVRVLPKPPGLQESETPEWKAIGMATRRGFDEIADAADQGAPAEKILAVLGSTLKNCVACHQTFQIETSREPIQ